MISLKIIYEDADFLVVNKPAGLLVHPVTTRIIILSSRRWEKNYKTSMKAPVFGSGCNGVHAAGENAGLKKGIKEEETLVDWLLDYYPPIASVGDAPGERPGIVHRLDRDTSGVMVLAKNEPTFQYLKKLFQSHEIKKTYLALLYGILKPRRGEITLSLGLKRGTVKRTVHLKQVKMVKEARTRYLILKYLELGGQKFSLAEVRPLTGRTHQIRAHFQSVGHPVVGDKLYASRKSGVAIFQSLGLKRQFLHAESLEFTAPSGARMRFSAALPRDLEQALDLLKAVRVDPRPES